MAFPPSFTNFTCHLCGGEVRLSRDTGYERGVSPGVTARVPDDLELPMCGGCGEIYLDKEFSDRADASVGAVTMTPPGVPRCITGQFTCARLMWGEPKCPPLKCLNTPEPEAGE